MKVLIVSDTHTNTTLLQGAIYHAQEEGCTELWHLGDNYTDTEMVSCGPLTIRRVPGLWCSAYKASFIPNIISFNCLCSSVTLVHDILECRRLEQNGPWITFHGHTHHPAIECTTEKISINPGHLKKSFDRGYPATYLLAEYFEEKDGMIWNFCQYSGNQEFLSHTTIRLIDGIFQKPQVISGSFLGKLTP